MASGQADRLRHAQRDLEHARRSLGPAVRRDHVTRREPKPETQAWKAAPGGALSLRQFLVRSGAGPRRRLLEAARAGRLRLNGQPTADLDALVRPGSDRVELDGRRLFIEGTLVCLAVNKPPGYLSTCRDERGRRTVLALVPPAFRRFRLFPVGRLDAASRGLLLLTNDGPLAYRLTHPRFGVEKEYEATLLEPLGATALQRLRDGVVLADGPALPARVSQVGASTSGVRYQMVLREGRNQEVRRMVAAVGGQVRDLVRTRIGGLRLGRLRAGQARLLRPEEIGALGAPAGAAVVQTDGRQRATEGSAPSGEVPVPRSPPQRQRAGRVGRRADRQDSGAGAARPPRGGRRPGAAPPGPRSDGAVCSMGDTRRGLADGGSLGSGFRRNDGEGCLSKVRMSWSAHMSCLTPDGG